VELFRGKCAEIIGESMYRLGVETIFGLPHPPVSELYEFFARKASFRPALSLKEAASACLGMELGGMRSFIVTSGTGLFEAMESISYAVAFEIPFTMVHVGTSLPGFGNPYPYQGDLDLLTAGDFPPLVFTPANLGEIPALLRRMREVAETNGVPAVLYLDSALFQMTGEIEIDLDRESPGRSTGRGFREEKRRVVTSLRLDVDQMEKNILSLSEKWQRLSTVAAADSYKMESAQAAIVAYGACAFIARKVVDRLNALGKKIGLLRPLTLSPFPDLKKGGRRVK
jgi:pyruvate/2-oxoacid:ferredoxin oxidoreductase alpha subunit